VLDIIETLAVLNSQFSGTNLQTFATIVESILSLSGSVTTLSVSRMSEVSYRTVQRFYALKSLDWVVIRLLLFRTFIYDATHHYLLVGDETVEDKAGRHTHGVSRFYSSIYKQAINSVSFLAFSFVDVSTRKSSLIGCGQLIKESTKKPVVEKPTSSPKRSKGRPKGSKNQPKEPSSSLSYQTLKTLLLLLQTQLGRLLPALQCFHLVLDGFYGHEAYLLLALEHKLQIISKFKSTAHLQLPFQGTYSGSGRPKTKGEKVDLDQIPRVYWKQTQQEKNSPLITHLYQLQAYTPKMTGKLLNVVILVHINTATNQQSRTILFTNDLTLTAGQVIDYYCLRFQIEFDFRDAKQFFGLSSFKNYKATQVTNAVNMAFTMTLISKILLEKYQTLCQCPTMGVWELKTLFRVQKYVKSTLKCHNLNPDDLLNNLQFLNIARLEAIHV
jgi:putative transposase